MSRHRGSALRLRRASRCHLHTIAWKGTLRTPSPKSFLALVDGTEVAAVDLHYLPDGSASGMVILLKCGNWIEEDVPPLLCSLDDSYLPDLDLTHSSLA